MENPHEIIDRVMVESFGQMGNLVNRTIDPISYRYTNYKYDIHVRFASRLTEKDLESAANKLLINSCMRQLFYTKVVAPLYFFAYATCMHLHLRASPMMDGPFGCNFPPK